MITVMTVMLGGPTSSPAPMHVCHRPKNKDSSLYFFVDETGALWVKYKIPSEERLGRYRTETCAVYAPGMWVSLTVDEEES